ncbi:MAG: magnesium transporter [Nanoarchaeota archaeon]
MNTCYDSRKGHINFLNLEPKEQVTILNHQSLKKKKRILDKIDYEHIMNIFHHLDPDEITDLVQLLPIHRQKHILKLLNQEIKNKVNFLLRFSPKTAAGNMNLNYIIVDYNTPKSKIIERIKKHIDGGKKEPTVLVLDNSEKLLGELRISHLLFDKKEEIYEHIKPLITVKYNENQEECVRLFARNKHEKIVVLDTDNSIIGIIHAGSILKMASEENEKDFYNFAGLHKEEEITDSYKEKVKFRLSWLIVNLFTAFLAAFVVGFYEETIQEFVLLAAFMPIVAGMGGNAGTQTTAMMIRGIALKKVDSSLIKKIIGNEFFAAIINGAVIGIIVGTIASFFGESVLFGLVVGLSNLLNLIVAAVFGSLVPYFLEAFGFDPAVSSSVFVTTATDVLGFIIFLGLATAILI